MDTRLTTPEDAQERIRSTLPDWGTELLELEEAVGRILSEDAIADRDSPPFDRVCMDGLAVGSPPAEGAFLESRGVQPAGTPPAQLPEGSGIEVMTGCPLPTGAWGVLPYEDLESRAGGFAYHPRRPGSPARNVSRQGEDHSSGTLLLPAGSRLRAPEIGILASIGRVRPLVRRLPRIAVVATGDELVDPGESPRSHQIRRSNDLALRALLGQWGLPVASSHFLADDLRSSRSLLGSVIESHDLVVTTGGVSMGKFDFVPRILEEVGIAKIFHGVAQKPGKPFWYGTGGGKAVFALPGNPVAALVCARRYLVPALLAHVTPTPCPEPDFRPQGSLVHFIPVRSSEFGWTPVPSRGSGDFASLRGTDGFLEVAPFDWDVPSRFHSWEARS